MNVFRFLVAAVVLRDDAVLLLRRSEHETYLPGVWGVPCGKVEFGEEVQAAVIREFKEETGLMATVSDLLGYSMFMSHYKNEYRHNIQLNFLVKAKPGPVILSQSHSEYKWYPLSSISSSGVDQYNLLVIRQAERTHAPNPEPPPQH